MYGFSLQPIGVAELILLACDCVVCCCHMWVLTSTTRGILTLFCWPVIVWFAAAMCGYSLQPLGVSDLILLACDCVVCCCHVWVLTSTTRGSWPTFNTTSWLYGVLCQMYLSVLVWYATMSVTAFTTGGCWPHFTTIAIFHNKLTALSIVLLIQLSCQQCSPFLKNFTNHCGNNWPSVGSTPVFCWSTMPRCLEHPRLLLAAVWHDN